MGPYFLTTAALRVALFSNAGPLHSLIKGLKVDECWVSPLSHAIIQDSILTDDIAQRGRRLIGVALQLVANDVGRMSTPARSSRYPLPDQRAVDIWAQVRSAAVDIPEYDDGGATHPAQRLGPDELLVMSTAAALGIPLIGPAPTNPAELELLASVKVIFAPPDAYVPLA